MTRLNVHQTARYKKDLKRALKQGKKRDKLDDAVLYLMFQKPLPPHYQDHALTGNWAGHRECHLAPDWLLIYRLTANELELVRIGNHADLFQ